MKTSPVDLSFSLNDATQQTDVIRRKMDMDALRTRFSDQRTQQEKLRESCEGFEAIFIQKMWEQMRKTVSKEGYLHSKDEETYQSLFDVELSKKMATAGGIGLADMLYEQLSQQLDRTARTTSPGSYRVPLQMEPINTAVVSAVQPDAPLENKKLTAQELYSSLDEEEETTDDATPQEQQDSLEEALLSLESELEKGVPQSETGSTIRAEIASNLYPASIIPQEVSTETNKNDTPEDTLESIPLSTPTAEQPSGFRGTSWQAAGPVTANPKPVSNFGRHKKEVEGESVASTTPRRRGGLPEDTLWPHSGKVSSSFGWETDPASGNRRWNSGVTLQGSAGDPVTAILDGKVIFSGPREGYGNTIILEHSDGFLSYYGNVTAENLKIGDTIKRGMNFASIDANASSTPSGEKNASLYFELKRGEMALNPELTLNRTIRSNT